MKCLTLPPTKSENFTRLRRFLLLPAGKFAMIFVSEASDLGVGSVMETEEIRAAVEEVRRACVEADLAGADPAPDRRALKKLDESVARLLHAAEELLAEREAFAGRLRRRANARPAESRPVSAPSQVVGEFTPLPATDA